MNRTALVLLSLVALNACEIRVPAEPIHRSARGTTSSCTPDCRERWCGEADGCGGYCTACPGSEVCVDSLCYDDSPTSSCYPAAGECGWDGCGGWLGSCAWGDECSGNWCWPVEDSWPTETCTPDCSWGCGDDGCGGWCGDCWDTCTPDCSWGCGDDGCGGWCGDC